MEQLENDDKIPHVNIADPRNPPIFFLDGNGHIGHWHPQANTMPVYLEQTRKGGFRIDRDFEERGWAIMYSPYSQDTDLFTKHAMHDERATFEEYIGQWFHPNGKQTKVALNPPIGEMQSIGEVSVQIYPEDMLPPEVKSNRTGETGTSGGWKVEGKAGKPSGRKAKAG